MFDSNKLMTMQEIKEWSNYFCRTVSLWNRLEVFSLRLSIHPVIVLLLVSYINRPLALRGHVTNASFKQ